MKEKHPHFDLRTAFISVAGAVGRNAPHLRTPPNLDAMENRRSEGKAPSFRPCIFIVISIKLYTEVSQEGEGESASDLWSES